MDLVAVFASELQNILTPQDGWSVNLIVRVFLSSTLLLAYVIALARSFGSRTFASFTSYDFLTNVAAGSLVASAILGDSIVESALSILVLVLWQWLVSRLSAQSKAAQRVFDNEPVVLIENGELREKAMHRARVSQGNLHQQLRDAGVTEVSQVRFAVLESGGTITVVKG